MTPEQFKEEAIKITLKSIDRPPERWITYNEKLHTQIFEDTTQLKSGITLTSREVPILECVLSDSYFLITTERLVSSISTNHYEMLIKEVIGFSNEFEKENHEIIDGKRPKTNTLVVKGEGDKKLVFKIDSYYPAQFVKILVYNLSNYEQQGNWYLNPGSSWPR